MTLRKRLVDDGDFREVARSARVDVATRDQPCAERAEPIRAYRGRENDHLLAFERRIARFLDVARETECPRCRAASPSSGRALDTRHRSDRFAQALEECGAIGWSRRASPHVHARPSARELAIESEIATHECSERAPEQLRSNHEYERHRHLRDHQASADAGPALASGDTPPAPVQRIDRIGASCAKRRHGAKECCRRHLAAAVVTTSTRQSGDKSRNVVAAQVDSCATTSGPPTSRTQGRGRRQSPQAQALDKLQAHDAPTRRPERDAHAVIVAPARRPRELQVRDVRARDQATRDRRRRAVSSGLYWYRPRSRELPVAADLIVHGLRRYASRSCARAEIRHRRIRGSAAAPRAWRPSHAVELPPRWQACQ